MELLRALRAQDGVTLVFVEHIMAAVMGLSRLGAGAATRARCSLGAPAGGHRDPRVIEAYLGEEPHADA